MKWNRDEIAGYLSSIGLALLLAGWIRFSYESELTKFTEGILIVGGVLLLASIVVGFGAIVKFFSKRSSQLGTNTTILVVSVIAILVVVNYLGYRYHKRFDLTSGKLFTLSDQTTKLVKGLKSDVDIVFLAKKSDPSLDDLMDEYHNLSNHIHFRTVDPQEKPDVAKEYAVKRMDEVVVASGGRTEHLDPNPTPDASEEDITTAILKVTRDTVKNVCFVEGHGEDSLTDQGERGYSRAAAGLKREGYDMQSINLVKQGGVPSDCNVVVIAGPQEAYFPAEVDSLQKYLDGGGKMMILADPQVDVKLDPIYTAWNIDAGKNIVVDASGLGQLVGAGPAAPLVVDYGDSPITKNFTRMMTIFPLARTITIADKSKIEPQAVELLKTSGQSFTIPGLPKGEQKVKFDPKTDTLGPLSLGVAADMTSGKSKGARLVVIGNSNFAANPWINTQKNGDLFYNTIDWLAQDENLISIRPRKATNRSVTLTDAQAALYKWIDIGLIPGIVILTGIVVWWKRR
ncbi:MAG TPA: Gldg family protein [Candidatus Acidoferrum sp.]|nr:Gldg family protein [Candidatus Acidoferrum sp.]